jgi:hypothetical protein
MFFRVAHALDTETLVYSNCTLGLNICRTLSTSLADSFMVQNGQFDVICPMVITITVNFLSFEYNIEPILYSKLHAFNVAVTSRATWRHLHWCALAKCSSVVHEYKNVY